MAIIIAAKRHGFRRCGIAHSSEPTLYRDDHFASAQLQALANDPQLVVSYADTDLDDQQELLNGTSQITQAAITSEGALPGLGQADLAAMGIDALWGAALLEDAQRNAAKQVAETETLWDEALAEEAQREAAKVKAEPKPKKATGKAGSLDK